ncbi:MAG: hypothetical protein ACRD0P_06690 [Stackebrandtia sp.]
MLFPHTVTVYPTVSRTDTDGNVTAWAGTEGVPVPAYVQPRSSQANAAGAGKGGPSQQSTTEAVAYLSHFCPPIDAASAIEWDGWRWAMVADPLDQRGLDGALRMWRAEIRRAEKVTA